LLLAAFIRAHGVWHWPIRYSMPPAKFFG